MIADCFLIIFIGYSVLTSQMIVIPFYLQRKMSWGGVKWHAYDLGWGAFDKSPAYQFPETWE